MPVSRVRAWAAQASTWLSRLRPLRARLREWLSHLHVLLGRLRAWAAGSSVLAPPARRSVATGGFVAILCVAVLSSWLGGTPTAAPATSASPSPSASGSPSAPPRPTASPSSSPSRKPDPTKPPKGTIMTRTGSAAVALTFDDGPHPTWTPRVLDQLRAAQVKATFCMIGQQVRANAVLVRRIVAEGHTLCNHSWSHDMKLGRRTEAEIRADLQRTDAAIHAVVPNVPIRYFRQPGGKWTAGEIRVLRAMGKIPLGWSVDPWDWANPGTEAIVSRVLSHTRAGTVVLMHDGGGDRAQTVAALRRLLPALKSRYALRALPVAP